MKESSTFKTTLLGYDQEQVLTYLELLLKAVKKEREGFERERKAYQARIAKLEKQVAERDKILFGARDYVKDLNLHIASLERQLEDLKQSAGRMSTDE